MRASAASVEVARLLAAFPMPRVPDTTQAVYIEELSKLQSPEALRDAVVALVQAETRLPSIALVRETYRRYADRYATPALPEPEPTPAERAANLARLRELRDSIGATE